jgi:uncharacterized protein
MIYLVLVFACVATWLLFRDTIAEYRALQQGADRIRVFRSWTVKPLLWWGVGSVVGLAAIGRLRALIEVPPELAMTVPRWVVKSGPGVLFGAGVGMVVVAFLSTRKTAKAPPTIGDIAALEPRNATERRWVAALSITAGVTEELFFRLLWPLVLTILLGDPLTAWLVAGILFAAGHAYQGAAGVIVTGIVGGFMTLVYLGTGSIWAPIALHAAIDLNGLLLRPWLQARKK